MDDLLFKAAEAYKELMNYEYILIGGTSKRKIIISILSSDADKFTHVCGLDHLKDIPSVTAKKSREKEMIFKKILQKKISYDIIAKSKYFNQPLSTSSTGEVFNIKTRIEQTVNIKNYFDNAYNGSFCKWNKKNSNGSIIRRTNIDADYLLAVPTLTQGIKMYLFFFQTNKEEKDKTAPIRLTLFSAFTDVDCLSVGQQSFCTILKEQCINKCSGEKIVLYDRLKQPVLL